VNFEQPYITGYATIRVPDADARKRRLPGNPPIPAGEHCNGARGMAFNHYLACKHEDEMAWRCFLAEDQFSVPHRSLSARIRNPTQFFQTETVEFLN
jgi:hypothetical protein